MNNFNKIAPNVKIALGQIKTITGDLEGNTNRILENIKKSIEEKVDILVFPELAISAYNCGMLYNQQNFVDYQTKFLEKIIVPSVPESMVVIIGFVRVIGKRFEGVPEIANSVAVIQGGRIIDTYDKILLANGGHHDDRHYFAPGGLPQTIKVKIQDQEIILGTPICEDTWFMDHRRDIVRELVQNGAELIITVNQSYFYYGKQLKRRAMYQKHAKDNNVYVISVNNSGIGDINKNFMIYDGGSMVVNPEGQIIAEAKRFNEDFCIVNLSEDQQPSKISENSKYEEIFESLVFAQKHIFADLGLKKAQVHVSGGIDSSVVLPIVVSAMGKENVIAISNPSKYNGDTTKSNAQKLCDTLGVKLYWNSLDGIQKEFIESHKNAFGEDSVKPLSISTFDAVGRTVQGLAASHTFGTGIVATGNHTEIVLGWASFHDIGSIGVMSLIGDLTKVEVFELAKYINEKYDKEIIPSNLYDGSTPPAAELADANLDPWDYYVVSGICAMLIRKMKNISEIVQSFKDKTLPEDFFPVNSKGKTIYENITLSDFEKQVKMCFDRSKISVFKTAQSAPIVLISPISRGFSTREVLVNKFKGFFSEDIFISPKDYAFA